MPSSHGWAAMILRTIWLITDNQDPMIWDFLEQHQYNPAELFFLLSAKENKLILHTKKGVNLYLLPKGHKYMESHIQRFRNSTTEKFCCMNSLDYAAPEDQKLALDWLEERLGLR